MFSSDIIGNVISAHKSWSVAHTQAIHNSNLILKCSCFDHEHKLQEMFMLSDKLIIFFKIRLVLKLCVELWMRILVFVNILAILKIGWLPKCSCQ